MQFEAENIYHIYNRGNNRQKKFFGQEHYFLFLRKLRIHLLKYADLLAYCLMPNHFHLLIKVKENYQGLNLDSPGDLKSPGESSNLNNEIAILLRSYTRAINKQQERTGSLFQQRTKSKCLSDYQLCTNVNNDLPFICFNYIHQNPLKANLVSRMEDWEYSSFKDYCSYRDGTLCNKELTIDLLGLKEESIYRMSSNLIDSEKKNLIF